MRLIGGKYHVLSHVRMHMGLIGGKYHVLSRIRMHMGLIGGTYYVLPGIEAQTGVGACCIMFGIKVKNRDFVLY
jgi:hypothetical protein